MDKELFKVLETLHDASHNFRKAMEGNTGGKTMEQLEELTVLQKSLDSLTFMLSFNLRRTWVK